MVRARVAEAPGELELAKGDILTLLELAHDLRNEIVEAYEDYAIRNNCGVSNRWKLAKSDGEIRAYRESKRGVEARKTSLSERKPQAWLASRSNVRRVMLIGRIPGRLDDAMFAYTAYDTPSLRARCVYFHDELSDCAMLATIAKPTESEPFRFCGVGWYLKAVPTNFVRDRDVLVLNYTDMGVLSNGDRYGVSIVHSITHNGLPELPERDFVRADISIATVFREISETHVEVFTVDLLDVKGSVPKSFQVQELGTVFRNMSMSSEIALNKKLFERLVVQSRIRSNSRNRPGSAMSINFSGETPDACECCSRRTGGLFNSNHMCQLCEKNICRKCVSKRELVVQATNDFVTTKSVDFCVSCILEARPSSSLDAARRAIQGKKRVTSPQR